MKDRAAFIRNAVARGISNIDNIRLEYNSFKDGGDTKKLIFLNSLEKALSKNQRYNTPEWRKYLTELAFRESSFRPEVTNKIGAKGYFQLMPENRTSTWSDPILLFEQMFALTDSNLNYFKRNMTKADLIKAQQQGITIYDLARAAHLGGALNALKALRGLGNAKDMNNTSVLDYMMLFSQTPRTNAELRGYTPIVDNVTLPKGDVVTTDLILSNALPKETGSEIINPNTDKDDIKAEVQLPEITVIGHKPDISFELPTLIEEIPTIKEIPSIPEFIKLPSILIFTAYKEPEISPMQKVLEDEIITAERRNKLGYNYKDTNISDMVLLLLFLRNMGNVTADGGNLFGEGGNAWTPADTTWHQQWLEGRQLQFAENYNSATDELKERFIKYNTDTAEHQIDNLRNSRVYNNTRDLALDAGRSPLDLAASPTMGGYTYLGALTPEGGSFIYVSPKGGTTDTSIRGKKGYYGPRGGFIHEGTHGTVLPMVGDDNIDENIMIPRSPQENKIAQIVAEAGDNVYSERYGVTEPFLAGNYYERPPEIQAELYRNREEQGLKPDYLVQLKDVLRWRAEGKLPYGLARFSDEVLVRMYNEVASNDNIQLNNSIYNPLSDTGNNIAAFGGNLFFMGGDNETLKLKTPSLNESKRLGVMVGVAPFVRPKGYIGGTLAETRDKYWQMDNEMRILTDSVANEYGINPDLLRSRMDSEGYTDSRIAEINNDIKKGTSYALTGEKLFHSQATPAVAGEEFGLDDVATYINNGTVNLINEDWGDGSIINEKGRSTNLAVGDNYSDNIGIMAATLKAMRAQAKKDFPWASNSDLDRYALAYYNRGMIGGKKWVKNGAKGYKITKHGLGGFII